MYYLQIKSTDQYTERFTSAITITVAENCCRRSTETLIHKHTSILQYFTEVILWMRKKTPCTTKLDSWQMSNGSCPSVSISKGRWGHKDRSEERFKVKREESEGWVGFLRQQVKQTWEVIWKRRGGVLQKMEQRQVGAEDRPGILVHHCVE